MKKKGAITDLFVLMIIAFILSTLVVVFVYTSNEIKDGMIENSDALQKALGDDDNATTIIESTFGAVPTSLEALKWISGMLIVGMMIAILITAFLIRTHPVFFVIYIFVWVFAIIVAVPIANTYETLYETDPLTETYSGFTAQNYILLNLHIWITVIGGIAGIVMFVNMLRRRGEGDLI